MYGQQMEQRECECSSADYAGMLARWAKAELLKEKVKARLEKHYGKKLDKAADLIVEVVTARAKEADSLEAKQGELEDTMDQIYGEEGE